MIRFLPIHAVQRTVGWHVRSFPNFALALLVERKREARRSSIVVARPAMAAETIEVLILSSSSISVLLLSVGGFALI